MVALGIASIWTTWRARRNQRARLRSEWGGPRERSRDMDAIADLFRSQEPVRIAVDDRTASDLLIDDVFAWLDRTESCVGQQVLYRRLRSTPHALDAFDALVERVSENASQRERAQAALARLQDSSAYYLHRLARPEALTPRRWHVVFPMWTAAILVALSLIVVWPPLLFAVAVALATNIVIRLATGRRVSGEISTFRQVGPLLAVAKALTPIVSPETAALTGTLVDDVAALSRVGAIVRWITRDPITTPDIVFMTLEYLNMLLLADLTALYFVGRELCSRAENLAKIIDAVGEIDAAVASASVRCGVQQWTRPRFVAPGESAVLTDIYHPLVADAVPNSILLAPPHGILITGSNMSGKSTLLRTLGVNVVLAQTIATCLARAYEAPVYRVRGCIGHSDDLLGGKSYYLVEVESVVALLRASERSEPQLFIFDELFRGTNAVERIAAAEAVLDAIVGGGKPHVALVATHDAELVELLQAKYAVWHLSDSIGPEGLVFDYRLVPGPAVSRNAIALLRMNGAPPAIVDRALARVRESA